MSEVKRLSLDLEYPFQYREDTEGNLCYYADYAALKEQFDFKQNLTEQVVALQKQCDALAAENVEIKAKVAIHAAGFSVCPVCSHEEPSETDDIVWMVNEIPTPATDAYLNSVRADGAEAVAAYHKERADALLDVDRRGANEHKVSYMAARDVAAKLRAGEPS